MQKVIHISQVLQQMNHAMKYHQTVSLKAWRIGRGHHDPDRGTVRSYDRLFVTSHSPYGTYVLKDPLAEDPAQQYRRVCEALICEFEGKKVIW